MRKLLPLALMAVTGCGTMLDTVCRPLADSEAPSPRVFGGVQTDWELAGTSGCCHWNPLTFIIFGLDLPLSAAMDVVLLPITGTIALVRR